MVENDFIYYIQRHGIDVASVHVTSLHAKSVCIFLKLDFFLQFSFDDWNPNEATDENYLRL
jgi:hypothetical protein